MDDNYPPGRENDPNAPYNQPDEEFDPLMEDAAREEGEDLEEDDLDDETEEEEDL